MNSPADIMFDVRREELVPLAERAAVYVDTAKRPETAHAIPIGVPISIAAATWPEKEWSQAWIALVDRAFLAHADELALHPMLETWCSVVQRCGHRA